MKRKNKKIEILNKFVNEQLSQDLEEEDLSATEADLVADAGDSEEKSENPDTSEEDSFGYEAIKSLKKIQDFLDKTISQIADKDSTEDSSEEESSEEESSEEESSEEESSEEESSEEKASEEDSSEEEASSEEASEEESSEEDSSEEESSEASKDESIEEAEESTEEEKTSEDAGAEEESKDEEEISTDSVADQPEYSDAYRDQMENGILNTDSDTLISKIASRQLYKLDDEIMKVIEDKIQKKVEAAMLGLKANLLNPNK